LFGVAWPWDFFPFTASSEGNWREEDGMEIRMAAGKRLGKFGLTVFFAIMAKQIGIFGEFGSGKSTLVGLLAGIHRPA
jgi:ABC-type transport system involved in cytochrome bd biosynthesis fused ATPase/permease subunit